MNGVHCQTSAAMIAHSGRLADPVGLWPVLTEQVADPPQHAVEEAVLRVEQRVLPEQRGGHRDDEERGDHHRAHDTAAPELAVEEQGDEQPEDQADEDHGHREDDRDDDRGPGVGVGEDPTVVVQPVEADLVRVVGVPVHERDAEGHEERQLRDDDHEDQRRQQWCTTGPGAGASQGGVVRGRRRRGAGAGGLGDGAHERSFLVTMCRRRLGASSGERPVTARRFTARPWTGTGRRRPRRAPDRCPGPAGRSSGRRSPS